MNVKNLVFLGSFENESGKIMVSDPCYDRDTWCQKVINNIKTGIWNSYIKQKDNRNNVLYAIHLDYINRTFGWKVESTSIGVDSGQCGIFDDKHYRDDNIIKDYPMFEREFIPKDEGEKWYCACCDKTLNGIYAGIIPYGVVSSSGYGDGCYIASIAKNANNEIIAIKIDFFV